METERQKERQRNEATSIRASHLACRINFILYVGKGALVASSVCVCVGGVSLCV